mmetsp:Transcript_6733/g.17231  ORF Transcript_6733/g.17231 Transcript_6733/m.17231 type:complete len:291 (-) Transcript_6733:1306-2178(-)
MPKRSATSWSCSSSCSAYRHLATLTRTHCTAALGAMPRQLPPASVAAKHTSREKPPCLADGRHTMCTRVRAHVTPDSGCGSSLAPGGSCEPPPAAPAAAETVIVSRQFSSDKCSGTLPSRPIVRLTAVGVSAGPISKRGGWSSRTESCTHFIAEAAEGEVVPVVRLTCLSTASKHTMWLPASPGHGVHANSADEGLVPLEAESRAVGGIGPAPYPTTVSSASTGPGDPAWAGWRSSPLRVKRTSDPTLVISEHGYRLPPMSTIPWPPSRAARTEHPPLDSAKASTLSEGA